MTVLLPHAAVSRVRTGCVSSWPHKKVPLSVSCASFLVFCVLEACCRRKLKVRMLQLKAKQTAVSSIDAHETSSA